MTDFPQESAAPPRKAHAKPTRLEAAVAHLKREWQLYLMLLPMVVWLLAVILVAVQFEQIVTMISSPV